nr:hypothetical protein [Tanacetum cinerariifolium]
MSWGWRKILKLRPTVRVFFWSKIRDGNNTSLWFDRWRVTGPLANHVSTRDMHRARLNPSAKVKDIVDKYPILIESTSPIMEDNSDFVMWRCCNGMVKKFSVSQVWLDIRFRDSKVDWYHMVWFPSCIPRHAFNLWLIIRRKLKTQDLILSWDISHSLGLSLSHRSCLWEEIGVAKHLPASHHKAKESNDVLGVKIKKVDGKGMRTGILRTALRGMPLNQPGTFVTSTDGTVRQVENQQIQHNNATEKNASSSGIHSCSDEIYGGAMLGSQHGTIGNSFASVVQAKNNKKVVKIKELRNEVVVEGAAVAIPFEAVEEVKSRFSNTLYGFFIGKRLAFPLVENYVKYGLKRVQLHDDFFLFQFESKEGMERVLEDGPWIIRTVPLILNVWSPNTDLKKAEIKKAVWIKLHHVPIVAYSEIRLSLITTQIGKPITLDSYTSNMCLSSWGKSTYARALIEVSAENELLDSVVIAIPVHKDKGHTLATIDIEYEWNPPRCATCLIFDHHTDKCPKLPKPTYVENVNGDGFVEVKKKKNKNKNRQNKVAGVRLSKPQPQLHYRRVEKGDSSKKVHSDTSQIPEIRVSNSFGILDDDKGEESSSLKNEDVLNISGNDIDEEIHVGRDDKNVNGDGFVEVKKKKNKNKNRQNKVVGVRLSKPRPQLHYRRVEKGDSSKKVHSDTSQIPEIRVSNSFGILDDDKGEESSSLKNEDVLNISDNDIDEEIHVGRDDKVISNVPGATLPLTMFLMIKFATWNIRGLNFSPKQNEIRHIIYENNLSMCVILESHVKDSNLYRLCSLVFKHWDWCSNGAWCNKGTRIILGWNQNDVDVVIIDQDDQVVHTRIWLKMERKEVYSSFVYAHNKYMHRCSLWMSLCKHNVYIRNRPWSIMGDFNSSLFIAESTASSSTVGIAMRDFRGCVEEMEMTNVQSMGLYYTWNQKPRGGHGILKKLDRIMENSEFQDRFVGAHAIFKPYRVSGHSPSILCIPTMSKTNPKPFKFFNILTSHEKFLDVVKAEWEHYISGFHMYRVVKKLKNLKKPFRKLRYEKGDLHANVNRLRNDLDTIQTSLDTDPFNVALQGDSNYAYFHKVVKSRVSRSRIDVVTNSEGIIYENDMVPNAFVEHYKLFLGQAGNVDHFNSNNLFKVWLNEQDALDMVRNVSDQEKWKVKDTDSFSYHRYCSILEIINLCFADDLFLFAYGDVDSASIIKEALDEFKNASGLVLSLPKSTAYFCNVLNHVKLSILQALLFEEGKLPVKCLGVPLVSSRLMIRDCNELIDKVQIRIQDWKNKALSIAESIGCFVAHRDMARAGLTPNSKVHDVIINGTWLWPHDLIAKFPVLNNYNVPINDEDVDRLVWRDIHGNVKKISVSQVWDDIRFRDSKVNWYSMVWFPSCIPRHAINLWLIVRRKLKTQDLILAWDISSSLGV